MSEPTYVLGSLEEANKVTAVRLTDKRRFARTGDIFRLSPHKGVYVWGRLIKKSKFFGLNALFNLVYVYDALGPELPSPELLTPHNLMIGPVVVNNLGWVRGYWQIIVSEPLRPEDMLKKHLFFKHHGTGSRDQYDIVDEEGCLVGGCKVNPRSLSQSGFGNFNSVDWTLKGILRSRGLIPDM